MVVSGWLRGIVFVFVVTSVAVAYDGGLEAQELTSVPWRCPLYHKQLKVRVE